MMNTILITSLQHCRSRDESGQKLEGHWCIVRILGIKICWMIICFGRFSWGISGAFAK